MSENTTTPAEQPAILISQSLMKSIKNCTDDKKPSECSLVVEQKFIYNRFNEFVASEAQNLGAWFEYQATGSKPKNGDIPMPDTINKGKELAKPYRVMEQQVRNFKNIMSHYGLEILEVGKKIEAAGLVGTIDLLVKTTKDIYQYDEKKKEDILIAPAGQRIILDLKSTGLLDDRDKWNPYSWNMELLHTKFDLVLQPVHYKLIGAHKDVFGEDLPFWFMLFSTTNEHDYRIIDFKVSGRDYEVHADLIQTTRSWLQYFQKNGWDAKVLPSVSRCAECPIKLGCKHFAHVPKITQFHLSQEENN